MKGKTILTVLGARNGGMATAADIAAAGFPVRLFEGLPPTDNFNKLAQEKEVQNTGSRWVKWFEIGFEPDTGKATHYFYIIENSQHKTVGPVYLYIFSINMDVGSDAGLSGKHGKPRWILTQVRLTIEIHPRPEVQEIRPDISGLNVEFHIIWNLRLTR